jgi:hypothetical protein
VHALYANAFCPRPMDGRQELFVSISEGPKLRGTSAAVPSAPRTSLAREIGLAETWTVDGLSPCAINDTLPSGSGQSTRVLQSSPERREADPSAVLRSSSCRAAVATAGADPAASAATAAEGNY